MAFSCSVWRYLMAAAGTLLLLPAVAQSTAKPAAKSGAIPAAKRATKPAPVTAAPAPKPAPCACPAALLTTEAYVARNYAGFGDKVTPRARPRYAAFVDSLLARAAGASSDTACHRLLRIYTRFFHDGHLGIIRKSPPVAKAAPKVTGKGKTGSKKRVAAKSAGKPRPPVADPLTPTGAEPAAGVVVLTVPSFDIQYAPAVRALVTRYAAELATCQTLVLDLRGNDGGSFTASDPLLPLLASGPLVGSGAKTWCSPDNLRNLRDDYTYYKPQLDTALARQWGASIARMEEYEGRWFAQPADTLRLTATAPAARVAVLLNHGCASTTELLVLKAHQSNRVKLYGQPTNGTVDYGDVQFVDNTPCAAYTLRVATSRFDWLDDGAGYDQTGIRPDVLIAPAEPDWVGYAIRSLSAAR